MLGDEHGELLRHRAPGYQLALKDDDVDSLQFAALIIAGRQALAQQQPERAAELLTKALGLWRGRPFMDVPPSEMVDGEAERMVEARLDALELSIEAEIGCGRYAEATPEVFRLTADHPLREGFWGLLMRALDAAGRHAEALAAYARAREVIADQLGVDPGEALQSLYERLLRDEPPPRSQAPSPPAPPPMQLPPDINDFTGRSSDVDRLCALSPAEGDDGGVVKVGLVAGAGGLGKTTLTVHAAHLLKPHFPDGQLYVNLLGASPRPLLPSDVLARFLRDLGVEAPQLPADEEERAALLRTRLYGRRMLLLLDNARDAAQVRPLLPGSASCTVLVTTRVRMPDLAVTRLVDLDVLNDEDARTLFTSIVGTDRVEAGAEATDEVLAACAGLPLAIRIAGARLAARPGWSMRTLATKLHNEQRRLDEFRVGDLAVRASFEVSYASLPAPVGPAGIDQARAFRLLGLWPGPAIRLPAAAALFGQPDDDTTDVLEQLVDTHLLESPAPDLYRFHDLLRVYAAERCQDEPEQARQDALRRILTWYLHTADAAARVISPNRTPVPLVAAEPGISPLGFASLEEALDWAEGERANLMAGTRQAAACGMHEIAWQLAAAAVSFYYRRSHWADWLATHKTGLASAHELGDALAEAWMLNSLGMLHGEQNMAEAAGYFQQALDIQRRIGDTQGEARAANNVAHGYLQAGRFDEALDAGRNALPIQRQAGTRYGEGITLSILGAALRGLGRLDDSVGRFRDALAIYRELDDQQCEADALCDLGSVYLDEQRVDDAIDTLRKSLAIWQSIEDRHGQAMTLRALGTAWRSAGKPDEASRCLADAQQILEQLGDHAQAAEIRVELALSFGIASMELAPAATAAISSSSPPVSGLPSAASPIPGYSPADITGLPAPEAPPQPSNGDPVLDPTTADFLGTPGNTERQAADSTGHPAETDSPAPSEPAFPAADTNQRQDNQTPPGTPHRPATEARPDVPGHDRCPDPLTARTPTELLKALHDFYTWQGNPSYRQMERRAQAHKRTGSYVTMRKYLRGNALPEMEMLVTIVIACGGQPEHQDAFRTAWRNVQLRPNPGDDEAT
jgi:tetratricopeptide (TPR) repeat protein